MDDCSLKYYSDVTSRKIDWLWYPYIPFGKITVIQGDPGEGKTTFVLSLLSIISNGEKLPFSDNCVSGKVIYQNTEDDNSDTIKPRLELHQRIVLISVSLKSVPIRFHLTVTSLPNRSRESTLGFLYSILSNPFSEKTST